MNIPTLLCDFYKVSHREQYPDKTEIVYATWTPRSNKYFPRSDKVVAFGFQAFIMKYIIGVFDESFFGRPKDEIVQEYSRYIKFCLGVETPYTKHIEDLWDLGFLPLEIKAVPEGTLVPIRCPMLTICNTDNNFFWLTNYFETLMSCELWLPSTTATIAHEYRKILDEFAELSSDSPEFVYFQGHDFSMRGMGSLESAKLGGSGHLLSFLGTDTIPAIMHLEEYYGANIEDYMVGCSIPATEHSVMCAGGSDNEFETYRRLITEVYPKGMVSIVSDTWDLWECIEKVIKPLKKEILERNGKVVIRPDSGDPVRIITGYTEEEVKNELILINGEYFNVLGTKVHKSAIKGLAETLWEIFGGTFNSKGYLDINSHIGMIYGDSITLDRCEQICERLVQKGFASTNVVFGIGSYTYQYNTRDTFGFAMKSTYCMIGGQEKKIFKNPATDDGTKKSNIGMVKVVGDMTCVDDLLVGDDFSGDLLRTIFKNGDLKVFTTLGEIRNRLNKGFRNGI